MEKKLILVKKMSKVKAISIVLLLIVALSSIVYFLPGHFWLMVSAVISGLFIFKWIDDFFKAVNTDLEKDQEIHNPSESETTEFYERLEQGLKEEQERRNP